MWPYFVIAALAALFVWAGSAVGKRVPEKYRTVAVIAAYALAILTFSFFAGARDLHTVGIDVYYYAVPAFDLSLESGFGEFFSESRFSGWEPLIKILFWVGANATHNLGGFFFLLELFFAAPTLIAVRLLLKDSEYVYLGVFIFGILFFPLSLNLMRQSVAMGFAFLSFVFVKERRPIPFVLVVIIAALFHATALVALLFYPLFVIGARGKGSFPVKAAVMALIVTALMVSAPLVFNQISPLFGRYGSYISGAIEMTTQGWRLVGGTALFFIGIGVAYYLCLSYRNSRPARFLELSGMAYVVFFGVIIHAMWMIVAPLSRLALYFMMLVIPLIPLAIARIERRPPRIIFAVTAMLGFCVYAYLYHGVFDIQVVAPYLLA